MTVDRKSGRSSSFLSISNHKTYLQLYSRPYAVVSSSSLPLFQVGHTDLPIEPSLNTPNTLLYHQLQKSGSGNLPTILTRELVGVDDLHSLSPSNPNSKVLSPALQQTTYCDFFHNGPISTVYADPCTHPALLLLVDHLNYLLRHPHSLVSTPNTQKIVLPRNPSIHTYEDLRIPFQVTQGHHVLLRTKEDNRNKSMEHAPHKYKTRNHQHLQLQSSHTQMPRQLCKITINNIQDIHLQCSPATLLQKSLRNETQEVQDRTSK